MAQDDEAPTAPFASLAMSFTMAKPASRAVTAVRSVPSVSRPGDHMPAAQRMRCPAGTVAASVPSATAAGRTVGSRDQQQKSQGGLKPWGVPLAAGALLIQLARMAVSHVLPPAVGSRGQPAALGDARVFPSLLPKRVNGGSSSPPGMPGGRKPAMVWFRNDLRLHDNEPLVAACRTATSLLPVYIFDPREYGKSPSGFDKTGPYRARFVLEALTDLRNRLRDAGSDLLVRIGKPEEVLPELARAVGAGAVYCQGEVTVEEERVEAAVSKALDKTGAALKVMWGGTLFHVEDLPFKLPCMPPNYADFRNALTGRSVRAPVEMPAQLKALPAATISPGEIPTLQQLGFNAATLWRCASDKDAAAAHLRGGESEALRRLTDFLHSVKQHATSGTTAEANHSASSSRGSQDLKAAPAFCCKVSPWLALGCLSPRQLYVQLQQTVGSQGQQDGVAAHPKLQSANKELDADMQWLLFELLWRDFFRFVTKKYTLTGVAQRLGRTNGLTAAPAAAPALAAC